MENLPPRTPHSSVLTPIRKISKGITKQFKKGIERIESGISLGRINQAFTPDEILDKEKKRSLTDVTRTTLPAIQEKPVRARPMSLSINVKGKDQQ